MLEDRPEELEGVHDVLTCELTRSGRRPCDERLPDRAVLGLVALIDMFIFLALLVIGYVYVWKKGALEWD